jgi:hypothetical protein
MLKIFTYLVNVLTDLLFWAKNKEQDLAVMRIKAINKAISLNARSIKNLEAERERVNQKYFSEGE